MYLQQAEILRGLDEKFTAKLLEVSVESSYEPGTVLFNKGDPASNFFVLVKGRIKLSIGDYQNSIYTVNHSGEAFGWSSLVGGNTYTASAKCFAPSTLRVFNRDHIETILSRDPDNAVRFYKNLALTLGNRLTVINSQLADYLSVNDKITYGTGQILEQTELV
jgi:CRP/FNR family cyclic AMP-dependent transcriptional regulator